MGWEGGVTGVYCRCSHGEPLLVGPIPNHLSLCIVGGPTI